MQNKKIKQKLWGGLHEASVNQAMHKFTVGRDMYQIQASDAKLFPYDIQTNIAHVEMLAEVGIITKTESKKLKIQLEKLLKLWNEGKFQLDPELEDVHTNIEDYLTRKLGIEIAGKLHTARSRNDQVTTDMYLFLHKEFKEIIICLEILIQVLNRQAKEYKDTVCPGYTHYQKAMVTTFGQILDSFSQSLQRDKNAIENTLEQFNFSPLGAVTGYGTTFPINPKLTAKKLKFKTIFKNSIDVITNRGEFETRLAADTSILANHLSQIAQTLIIFSTKEFGYISLADEFTTGSSIMPQKQNPDFLELTKAKASLIHGLTTALLGIGKAAFIGYNRDTQESKHLIMDIIDHTKPMLIIMAELITKLKIHKQKMHEASNSNFINSTQLMEQIAIDKKLPIRQVKKFIEKCVKNSIESGEENKIKINLEELEKWLQS